LGLKLPQTCVVHNLWAQTGLKLPEKLWNLPQTAYSLESFDKSGSVCLHADAGLFFPDPGNLAGSAFFIPVSVYYQNIPIKPRLDKIIFP
jgi:hypothetical protein